jgi:hypothetical protein
MNVLLISFLSSLLWRVRGGLKIKGKKLPSNKVWYAVFYAVYSCFYYEPSVSVFLVGFLASYSAYQLYGWGAYIGGLIHGGSFNREKDAECELIDDLLYPCRITYKGKVYWLKDYGRAFGFVGTCLTGLIISFLWGLHLNSLAVMVSGLGMGVCYYLGYLLNKVIPEQKAGWGYGEWIDGFFKGAVLAMVL